MTASATERRPTGRVAAFFAASMLLHATALIYVGGEDTTTLTTPASPAAGMAVRLAADGDTPAKPAAQAEADTTTADSPAPPTAPEPTVAPTTETPAENRTTANAAVPAETPSDAATSTAKPEPAASGSHPGATRDRVVAEVEDELARHFQYPYLARRRGWQGSVLLHFTVTRDGRVREVRVAHSSGHRVLDEAARRALAAVARVGPTDQPRMELQIPVHYRLRGT